MCSPTIDTCTEYLWRQAGSGGGQGVTRPDFHGSGRTWSAHEARGAASGLRCRRNRKNIAHKARGASLHRNRNQLRTLFPRFHTSKTQNGREAQPIVATQHSPRVAYHGLRGDYLSGRPALRRPSKKCSASSVRLKILSRACVPFMVHLGSILRTSLASALASSMFPNWA